MILWLCVLRNTGNGSSDRLKKSSTRTGCSLGDDSWSGEFSLVTLENVLKQAFGEIAKEDLSD